MRDWVELGRIGSPYGVLGWMHIQSFTEPAAGLLDYALWSLRAGGGEPVAYKLLEGRLQGRGLVARLAGIADREAAAALGGATIEVRRSELPPAGRRQYYRADLVGLKVCNLAGAELGVLAHFVEGPAEAMMVVRGAGGEQWIPAVPRYLRKVDLEGGRIVVDWPAEPGG